MDAPIYPLRSPIKPIGRLTSSRSISSSASDLSVSEDIVLPSSAIEEGIVPPVGFNPTVLNVDDFIAVVQTTMTHTDVALESLATAKKTTYTKATLEKAEQGSTIIALVLTLGVGIPTFGAGFVALPFIFGLSMALKNTIVRGNLASEDIIFIGNIMYLFALLKACPTIGKILEFKRCEEENIRIEKTTSTSTLWGYLGKTFSSKSRITPPTVVVDPTSTCTEVVSFATERNPAWNEFNADKKIIAFIVEAIDEYLRQIEIMILLLNRKRTSSGKASETIMVAHNKCSGLFTSIIQYLKLNNEEPNIGLLQKQPFFSNKLDTTAQQTELFKKVLEKTSEGSRTLIQCVNDGLTDTLNASIAFTQTAGKRKTYKRALKRNRKSKHH